VRAAADVDAGNMLRASILSGGLDEKPEVRLARLGPQRRRA